MMTFNVVVDDDDFDDDDFDDFDDVFIKSNRKSRSLLILLVTD